MTIAARLRISPLRAQGGDEIDLPYAPFPWRLKQCRQTGIVFLANPPAYEELSRDFAYEVTFEKETRARKQAEPLRYAISTALKRGIVIVDLQTALQRLPPRTFIDGHALSLKAGEALTTALRRLTMR